MARRDSSDREARRRIEEAARTGATELKLVGLGLTTLPESVGQLQNLRTLDVAENQLTTLPDTLGQLQNLQTLEARENQLTALPESLGQLQNLELLFAQWNQLTALPESLGQLQNLQQLDVENNQLTALPESLGQLQNLQQLDARRNQLAALPESLGQLQELVRLSLDGNPFKSAPPVYFQLRALESIDLERTGIERLPPDIKNLQKVTQIFVQGNQLRALPPELGDLPKLKNLHLEDNGLPDPYPELIKRGTEAVLTYLRSLAKEEEIEPQYEAKLILVGEGSVGKTCLVRALQTEAGKEKEAFDPKSETTHGIKIGPVVLPHPDLPETDITLNTWDFGGQEVYRITHQFFFGRRALYLMVWRPREGQEAGQLEFWLKSIRLRAPDAKVILVSTYADEGRHPEVDFDDLKRRYGEMIVGDHHEVSNAEGAGFDTLRKTMASEAAKLEHMGRRYNKRWLAARDQALAHPGPQITREAFDSIAKKHELTDDAAEVWLNLLHDLGRIVYYGDNEGLRDIIVIRPEWLTVAISYVLEDKPTRVRGGFLEHARLPEIWDQYPRKLHPFLLRLMEKFDISYRDPERQASLVGQLVPYTRPKLPWELSTPIQSGSQEVSLVCDMTDDPPGLIEWLIVRNHPYSTGNHWRRGVFLSHLGQEALVEMHSGRGELHITVRGSSPRYFLWKLKDGVDTLIEGRWPGLAPAWEIVCPGQNRNGEPCNARLPLDALESYVAVEYRCLKCQTVLDVDRILAPIAPMR